jgi:hypothetical protein
VRAVPLDNLGMDDRQMLELVNRMNAYWPGKFILRRRRPHETATFTMPGLHDSDTRSVTL